jgi:hypothetical protein
MPPLFHMRTPGVAYEHRAEAAAACVEALMLWKSSALGPGVGSGRWRARRRHMITGTITRVYLLALLAAPLSAQSAYRLIAKNVSIKDANFKGRNAVQLIATPGAANATSYAVVKDVAFRDGTIEVDLAGQPAAGAGEGARGFIGIAFRLQGDGRYEYMYLRPTNGRADDQVRRNHSTQYSSHPDSISPAHAKRLLRSMSRTWTCSRVSGPSTRLRWKAARRGSMCMERSSRASLSTI